MIRLRFVALLLALCAAPALAAPTRYVLAPAGSSLTFTFVQEGADTQGSFQDFTVRFPYDAQDLAASSLEVQVKMASVSTGYADRDEEVRGAQIFDVKTFPLAVYRATSLVKGSKGIEAVGRLTMRDVTRDLRIPLVIRPVTVGGVHGLELSGSTRVNRLDYGVGRGDWQSTDAIGNEVRIQWKVQLVPEPAAK